MVSCSNPVLPWRRSAFASTQFLRTHIGFHSPRSVGLGIVNVLAIAMEQSLALLVEIIVVFYGDRTVS